MPLLYYWRGDNYRRDLDYGAGYHLNQANPLLHQIDLNDSAWAFTRRRDGIYVLAAELVVKAKTLNPPGFRYGRYRVWGDLQYSHYFQVDGQPSIEYLIQALTIKANAPVLGAAFQGRAAVRRMTANDHLLLVAASRSLPLEWRARILPEERLEAALLLGAADTVNASIRVERPGIAEERARYLYQQATSRNHELVQSLHDLYDGRCQVCAWEPRESYGHSLCHGHHLQWISRGGEDRLENLILICPNHHAAVHRCDAPFDFDDLSFVFPDHREQLRLRDHLESPSTVS
jgi:hypothetical protein